ncbi:MAG TPA: alpha/beta hydrolase [Terracidiphilus sp.]|nr:alpha/beta hydrolase [Terracidiphilus sp.]
MTSHSYVSAGAHLQYVESGSGLPVLFLHPTPLDHFYWLPLIERLPSLRAMILDLRAHGASELGSGLPVGGFARVPDAPTLTMAQLAEDTIVLLDQLELRQAVFVGCSIGGYVLFELWRRIPERMRGLAFVCSKPQPDAEANHVKRADTIAKARSGAREALFDGMIQASTSATARTRRPTIVSALRARMTLGAEAIVAVQAGLAVRPDSVPTVREITAPVFALAGGEDFAVSAAEMEVLRSAPGGCDFHVLPDAGHFAAYEQPETVASLLATWLKQFEA